MFTYPLTPYRGDTFRRQFAFFADSDHAVTSDLTGVDMAAEIRTAPGAAVITTIGLTVTLPNLIDLELTPAQTAQLPPASSWDQVTGRRAREILATWQVSDNLALC